MQAEDKAAHGEEAPELGTASTLTDRTATTADVQEGDAPRPVDIGDAASTGSAVGQNTSSREAYAAARPLPTAASSENGLPAASRYVAYPEEKGRGRNLTPWRSVDPQEAQRILDVESAKTLRNLTRSGELVILKERERARVTSRSILEYIERHATVGGVSPALRLADCATLLGVDRWAIEDSVQARSLPHVVVGGRRLVPVAELLVALARIESGKKPPPGTSLHQILAKWRTAVVHPVRAGRLRALAWYEKDRTGFLQILSLMVLGTVLGGLIVVLLSNIADLLNVMVRALIIISLGLMACLGLLIVGLLVKALLVRLGGGRAVVRERHYGLLPLDQRLTIEREYATSGFWRLTGLAVVAGIAASYIVEANPTQYRIAQDWIRDFVAYWVSPAVRE